MQRRRSNSGLVRERKSGKGDISEVNTSFGDDFDDISGISRAGSPNKYPNSGTGCGLSSETASKLKRSSRIPVRSPVRYAPKYRRASQRATERKSSIDDNGFVDENDRRVDNEINGVNNSDKKKRRVSVQVINPCNFLANLSIYTQMVLILESGIFFENLLSRIANLMVRVSFSNNTTKSNRFLQSGIVWASNIIDFNISATFHDIGGTDFTNEVIIIEVYSHIDNNLRLVGLGFSQLKNDKTSGSMCHALSSEWISVFSNGGEVGRVCVSLIFGNISEEQSSSLSNSVSFNQVHEKFEESNEDAKGVKLSRDKVHIDFSKTQLMELKHGKVTGYQNKKKERTHSDATENRAYNVLPRKAYDSKGSIKSSDGNTLVNSSVPGSTKTTTQVGKSESRSSLTLKRSTSGAEKFSPSKYRDLSIIPENESILESTRQIAPSANRQKLYSSKRVSLSGQAVRERSIFPMNRANFE